MSLQQTAPTSHIVVHGVPYAYRRLGPNTGVPLLFLTNFRGTMDTWDPLLINAVASSHSVILFDNAGVGHSGGEAADTLDKMAFEVVAFVKALGFAQVDILGFSLGGMIGQEIALQEPSIVRKLILAGTNVGKGEGVVHPDPETAMKVALATPLDETSVIHSWCSESASSQAAGKAWWARIKERKVEGEKYADFFHGPVMMTMFAALAKWGGSYYRLQEIKMPVLVLAGARDAMSAPENNFILSQRLPNAQLIVYPDAGHGFLFQHHALVAQHIKVFLDME